MPGNIGKSIREIIWPEAKLLKTERPGKSINDAITDIMKDRTIFTPEMPYITQPRFELPKIETVHDLGKLTSTDMARVTAHER